MCHKDSKYSSGVLKNIRRKSVKLRSIVLTNKTSASFYMLLCWVFLQYAIILNSWKWKIYKKFNLHNTKFSWLILMSLSKWNFILFIYLHIWIGDPFVIISLFAGQDSSTSWLEFTMEHSLTSRLQWDSIPSIDR